MQDIVLSGTVSYPGVRAWMDCAYTIGWSVTPGRIVLTIPPQDVSEIQGTGNLMLSDGVNPPVKIADCVVVDLQAPQGDSGPLVLTLLDGRWRFDFSEISGRYNIPFERSQTIPPLAQPGSPGANQIQPPQAAPPGEEAILPGSMRTAKELATLLLKAMKVKKYDLSGLDPKATPSVNWVAVNPAQALAQLAGDLGCIVAFNPSTLAVSVLKQGDGKDLPGGELQSAPDLKAKPRPETLRLRGAPDHVQMRVVLLAIGEDFDGAFRPLAKLSYRPVDGDWTKYEPGSWSALPSTGFLPGARTFQDAVELAARSVYLYYAPLYFADPADVALLAANPERVKVNPALEFIRKELNRKPPVKPQQFAIVRPTTGKTAKADADFYDFRLLPFGNLVTTDDIGRAGVIPARCFGKHSPPEYVKIGEKVALKYDDTTTATEVKVPFSIVDIGNGDQAIKFAKRVYARHSDGKVYPAEIVIECAVEFALSSGYWFRSGWDVKVGASGATAARNGTAVHGDTKVGVIVREDVKYQRTAQYNTGNTFKGFSHNEKVMQKRADYYLRGELRKYELVESGDATYPGIRLIPLDGAVMQVSWSISPPTTRASRSTEHALYIPSFEQRRSIENNTLEDQRRAKYAAAAERDRQFAAFVQGGAIL
jgi:hypothetical protein